MALIVAAFVEIQRPASPHPAAARLSLHYADIGRLREMGFVCLTGVGVLECWSVGVLEFDEFDEFRRVGMLEIPC